MDESDMIFNNNNGAITAGGFNIKSLMMQLGISPITTVQNQSGGGSTDQVSDIFDGIIIPNWTYSHNKLFKHNKCVMNDNTDPDNCKVIDDDIYNQMMEAVTFYKQQKNKTKKTKIRHSVTKKRNLKKKN
jgi:hypothetical protein